MEIYYKSRKLEKCCNSQKDAYRQWGPKIADKVFQRMTEMRAIEFLGEMYHYPAARFHPLKENRKGQYAVDLVHPYRLVLEPCNQPLPVGSDGGIDLLKVTKVKVIEVHDYH
jgi:proteic killer suppression protein